MTNAAFTISWTQLKRIPNQPLFQINDPDYSLSPHTGMTRQHWKEAALYLLRGAFSYIHNIDEPMQFPKQPGKSYPLFPHQAKTERLEGLCRTLLIAAPLLIENPDLEINNIKVGYYYRNQITKLVSPSANTFIKPRGIDTGPTQTLVEFGALALCLFLIPQIIWDPLTSDQKDALAYTMLSYGEGPTIGSNWKFFNIFILSFFKQKGYAVNESLLTKYLQKALQHYKGAGWYNDAQNDAPAFDYYSMWAFQLYGRLWSEYFGIENYPEIASQFLRHFKELTHNYPYLFSRNGEMIMWGRSIAYRMGSIIPFPLMGLEKENAINYGWMRRISSGVLVQFLCNPHFMEHNIPTLGFYGAFEPAVQSYSCRASVFWMGKAFLGLLIPQDNPFWTATENEGAWENELGNDKVYNKFQQGSDMLITNYPNIGASEVRAWCHAAANGYEPFRSSENYNRLSYNSAFPWQADSPAGVVSMNYTFKNKINQWEPLRLFTFKKFEDGIYYRDAILETNTNIRLNLADITLPNGILRIDRMSTPTPVQVRLGHYALPILNEPIRKETRNANQFNAQIVDNGRYQLAMIPVRGWELMQTVTANGLHPESKESVVINVGDNYSSAGREPVIYVTLMLWKRSGENWTDDELAPIKKIRYMKKGNRVTVFFLNGETKNVQFYSDIC